MEVQYLNEASASNADLVFLPLECLPERYSADWYYWFLDAIIESGVPAIIIGERRNRVIKEGEFLDVYQTHQFKFQQLCKTIEVLKSLKSHTTVLFMDMWFPGIESLAYIRDCAKKDIKFVGMLHAGTWDPWDFISLNGCAQWGRDIEAGWLKIADKVIVATHFHRQLLEKTFGNLTRISVKPFPVRDLDRLDWGKKKNVVAFPHRLAPEKCPEEFEALKGIYFQRYPEDQGKVDFIRSMDVCSNKTEYYELLAQAKVSVSTARQETFGIAMIESERAGCIPVCPDRLSYPETLPDYPRYGNLFHAAKLINKGLSNQRPYGFYNGYLKADYVTRNIIQEALS